MPARIWNPKGTSKAEALAKLPKAQRDAFLQSLTSEELQALRYDWGFWGRPNQIIPAGRWFIWLVLAGRGFGKTRLASEAVRWAVQNGYRRLGLAAATASDIRDVMVEGESGVLNVFPDKERPKYEPSKRRITFRNGATAVLLSADDPKDFRGKQYDFFWGDELVTWPHLNEAWSNIVMGLRLPGKDTKAILTTTPKPLPLLKSFVDDPRVILTKGSTFENSANLSPQTLSYLKSTFVGTTIGRQELEGELLGGNPGALWVDKVIDQHRVKHHPELRRIIVAIDPSANQGTGSACECGIVAAGIGWDGHCYILEDLSGQYSPLQWVKVAWEAYVRRSADRIVYEANLGGAFVETTFRTSAHRNAPLKAVHASKGKAVRAEPVSALYERGLVHHVGLHKELEDQLTTWVPGKKSPDRLDALVWAVTELALGPGEMDASPILDFNDSQMFSRTF